MDEAGGRAAWRDAGRRLTRLGNEPAVWVGDEARRPDDCIRTSVEHNPAWPVSHWGNHDPASYGWFNARCMRGMPPLELSGVADRMRWKIFHDHVGFAVDVDGSCTRLPDDWLLEHVAFACWKTVGPMRPTLAHRRCDCTGQSMLPSHVYISEHSGRRAHEGCGPVHARQHRGSARGTYDTLHQDSVE